MAKTTTDHIAEVLTFFGDEYRRVGIRGFPYKYFIGKGELKPIKEDGSYAVSSIEELYPEKMEAIQKLYDQGVILRYQISSVDDEVEKLEERNECNLYAVCTVAEDKLKLDPGSENEFYIVKRGDDFFYNGAYLKLSKNAKYFKVFLALFAKIPHGGEVTYEDLIKEVKSRIPETKTRAEAEMRKFIQGNLTERTNGFLRSAKIEGTMSNGKPLIEILPKYGVRFNNRK